MGGDFDKERDQWAFNNAEIGAAHHCLSPLLRAVQIDLFGEDATVKLLRKEKPDAVINCTVLHTWHLIRKLPKPERIYTQTPASLS